MSKNHSLVVASFAFAFCVLTAHAQQPISTPVGPIVGNSQTVSGTNVSSFFGIPFAAPPVGTLRFRSPQPASAFIIPFKALPNNKFACPQAPDPVGLPPLYGTQTEDCLVLNVWTPAPLPVATDAKLLPVLVWIYGGSFTSGGIGLDGYQGDVLASSGSVIVVSINYRLGILGWGVYTGVDGKYSANLGLQDQQVCCIC